MNASLIILCVAAAALVAFATSCFVGVLLALGRRALQSRSAAAQSRVLLGLALLPAFVTIAVMGAALAPSFGWIPDHCVTAADVHAHPHICAHHEGVLPALPILLLASLFLLRHLVTGGRLLVVGVLALRADRALRRGAQGVTAGRAHVLPVDEPQAFVLGLLRPALFVTRGLLAPQNRVHLQTVLAHERAHLHRGDPLRRFFARLGSSFHLPGIGRWLERSLACAHEMAADECAAKVVGSRARVAEALVHMARASLPRHALAFGGTEIEVRVRALLDVRPRPEAPGPSVLWLLAATAVFAIAGGAGAVHHGVELLLGLLGT